MTKKSLAISAIILMSANLITRFIGFFYRIYMSNAIGSEGMGLYQLIMPIYMLAWTITSSGFTTTISKLTASENAKGQYGNMGRVLKQSLVICACVSLLVGGGLFLFADTIALYVLKDGRTAIALRLLSFCFPFMSAGSCIRGYFFGMQNSVIPAISQVLEQIVRITVVCILSSFFVPMGLEYACAAAVIGIVFGEILSFLFVFLSYLGFKKKHRFRQKPSLSSLSCLGLILSMALPLTASRVTSSLLSTAENILIPQRLMLFGQSQEASLSIFGQLTGMAMPLIQLPSALLMAISTTLVPAVSEAAVLGNQNRLRTTITKSLQLTAVIGLGAASIFAVFPSEICQIIYNDKTLGDLLWKLALLCPFLYLQITLNGLLNGLGEHLFLFRNNLISSVINLCFIYFLMPYYGVNAFICGWFVSIVVTSMRSIQKVSKQTKMDFHLFRWLGKPILCALAAALMARYVLMLLAPGKLTYIVCAGFMGILYLLFLFVTGSISKKDFL